MKKLIESFENVPMIGVSKHDELYNSVLEMLELHKQGRLTFEDTVNIIHDMIAEECPDGFCSRKK